MVKVPWRQKCVPKNEEVYRHQFERCQWQTKEQPNKIYLCYRWFLFLAYFTICIYSMCSPHRFTKPNKSYWIWWIYLTNWGLLICLFQSLFGLIIVQTTWFKKRAAFEAEPNVVPVFYKVYWIFQLTGVDTSLVITIIFWSLVYDPAIHVVDATNIMVHVLNSILMLLDTCLIMHPSYFKHVIYPVLLGLVYTFFSFIYFELGGTNRENENYIYKSLDWKNPGKSVIMLIVCMTAITIVHSIVWLVVKCRIKLRSLKKTKEEPIQSIYMQEKMALSDII